MLPSWTPALWVDVLDAMREFSADRFPSAPAAATAADDARSSPPWPLLVAARREAARPDVGQNATAFRPCAVGLLTRTVLSLAAVLLDMPYGGQVEQSDQRRRRRV